MAIYCCESCQQFADSLREANSENSRLKDELAKKDEQLAYWKRVEAKGYWVAYKFYGFAPRWTLQLGVEEDVYIIYSLGGNLKANTLSKLRNLWNAEQMREEK